MKSTAAAAFRWVFLAAALAPSPAGAWYFGIHGVIGKVAQNLLTPQARQGVAALLGERGLADVAACADWIIRRPATCAGFPLAALPQSGPWHYVDLDIADPRAPGDMMSYCAGGNCVVEQVRRAAAALANPSVPADQRRLALIMLVHLVGDVHQPMHAVNAGDRGGNSRPVILKGETINMHALWDSTVLAPSESKALDLNALAAQLEADIRRNPAAPGWGAGPAPNLAAQAALESFDIARRVIYPRYARCGGHPERRPEGPFTAPRTSALSVHAEDDAPAQHPVSPVVTLDPAYQAELRPIALQRLEVAAVRLTAILEQSFAAARPAAALRPASFGAAGMKMARSGQAALALP